MNNIEVKVVNAFGFHGKGGNPAGVVIDADEYSTTDKQTIAKKVGLSETAFVSESDIADFKLDFFTPTKQIAHCGHATVAVFSLLKQLGHLDNRISSKETIDGTRAIYFEGNEAYMEQKAPVFTPIHNSSEVLSNTLGLTKSDLVDELEPMIVNTGNSFLIVPVKNEDVLKSLACNQEAIHEISETYGLIGFYVFTITKNDEQIDATTRMFAPYYGIEEEAATGMAAGPLGCYFYRNITKKDTYVFKQGEFMTQPSPSLLTVKLETLNQKIQRLFAGGSAYIKEELVVQL